MPLTDRAIRNAKPGTKPLRMYDAGGLYLEVAPSGGKWWRLKSRFDGKERRLSLGVYPDVPLASRSEKDKETGKPVTIKGAREKRDEARQLIAAGVDPSAQRKADKHAEAGRASNSFEHVAREWHGRQATAWTDRHASGVMHRLEGNLFPVLGAEAIADIAAPALLAAVRQIESRGAYHSAHRLLQTAGQVFRYGVATGRCERDPSADLRGALTPHKERHQAAVTPDELPALLRASTKMQTEHVVPLSRQAMEVLREVRAIGGDGRYVSPARNPDKPISNNPALFALYRLGYKGKMASSSRRMIASGSV